MKLPKLRELVEALKVLFIEGPYTSKFPKKPSPAPEGYRGKPVYDEKYCMGCGACVEVCPARAIEKVDDPQTLKRTMTIHLGHCIFCGACHAACPTVKGVTLSTEYDLATLNRLESYERVEKELATCEVCGKIITAKEHLCWVADKLGVLAYSNPTLIMASLQKLGLVDDTAERDKTRPVGREDLVRILCPACRRDTLLTEQWARPYV